MDTTENSIEWYTGQKTATVSLTQRKHINRIHRMAEKHAELVEIVAENPDGSIVAHIPLSAIHMTIYGMKTGGFEGVDDDE